ncbi:MAG: hypothetical protein JW841_03280 [Deltaproteobacteria bacterium]|nr:hypothetical protein [Deltaproteobacteria bacterium]
MSKNAAISIRLPADIKASLVARAHAQHRSLSAQITHDLEIAANNDPGIKASHSCRFLGRFPSNTIVSDDDIALVRSMLWRRNK